MNFLKTFDSLAENEQEIVTAMSSAARDALRDAGVVPRNDDHVAVFDNECAKYFLACLESNAKKANVTLDEFRSSLKSFA